MDIREMTVRRCLNDPVVKALLEQHVPDLSRYPLGLFGGRKVTDIVDMAVARGMLRRERAEQVLDRINEDLKERET